MEEWVQIARQLMADMLEKMGIETEVEGSIKAGDIYLDVKSDEGGILIGKHGRTLESFQILVNRMVNKQAKKPMRVVCLDEGFTGNDQLKTNAVQTMKAKGVVSFRTV